MYPPPSKKFARPLAIAVRTVMKSPLIAAGLFDRLQRAINSAVECFVHIEDVGGSNPSSPTISPGYPVRQADKAGGLLREKGRWNFPPAFWTCQLFTATTASTKVSIWFSFRPATLIRPSSTRYTPNSCRSLCACSGVTPMSENMPRPSIRKS